MPTSAGKEHLSKCRRPVEEEQKSAGEEGSPADLVWGKKVSGQIAVGGVIQHLTIFIKAGAVAWAIPRMLRRIPLEGTAKVGTALFGRGQQILGGFEAVYKKLRLQNATGWIEYICTVIFSAHDTVTEEHCCRH